MLGSNLTTAREDNLALVIRLIHKAGICSRADIASATGLKQATITYIVNDLIDWGLVKETGSIEGRLKRRSIGITLNKESYRLIGVRLSRNNITIGVFDMDNNLLKKEVVHLSVDMTPEEVVDKMILSLKANLRTIENEKALGIGVAIPGPYIAKEGRIALMSGSSGWESVDIEARLQESLDLPVFLDHDANCAALAEWWHGETGERKYILLMQVDDGVGSAIMANGNLYRGGVGTAGEIGHSSIDFTGPKCQCGNRGCLELYCSTVALRQQYKTEHLLEGETGSLSAREIIKAVREGDPRARGVYAKTASFLAFGLVNAINLLNPEIIVLSGIMSQAGDYLLEVIQPILENRIVKDVYKNMDIRLSCFGEDNVLCGAGALVLEEALRQPTQYFKPA